LRQTDTYLEKGELIMEETLIQTFKRYYADYRAATNVDESFSDAYQALAYHVIEQTGQLAQEGNVAEIQNVVREFTEIRNSTGGSNDSLKDSFEQELVENMLNRVSH
jgi:soluble cytochrome b562